MPAARTLSSLELLGVPVEIRCEVPQISERLELCFARSSRRAMGGESRGGEALSAALFEAGGGFRVEIDGREPLSKKDSAEALRAFHHELIQAVMLRTPHLFCVHAGVVSVGGLGVVLPGLSMSGKSTLSLAFVRAGAGYLSDEVLAYDPDRGRALAFPRAVKIRDECVPYFPDLSAQFRGEGETRFLPFDALPGLELPSSVPVGAIVCPRWSGLGGATGLTPMTTGQALLELASSSLNFGTHRAASIDRLTELVRGAHAFHLEWREPEEAVRLVLSALGLGRQAERP